MRRLLICFTLLSGIATSAAIAQSDGVGLRIQKLEKEMKAVQRKVFPNGAPVQPEMGGSSSDAQGLTESGTAVSDLTARVNALEEQLKKITGDVETQGNRLAKLEAASKGFESRLKSVETPAPSAGSDEVGSAADTLKPVAVAKPTPVAPIKPAPKPEPKKALVAPEAPAATTPKTVKADPALKAKIDAIPIPRTGDAAEDAYAYGFRLWTAKLYPEAQVQLQSFLKKFPKHSKTSLAGNLLGRAFFDEGKFALASVAFYDNYQRDAKGARAQESLIYLGQSLIKLKRFTDACKAYAEFGDVYGKLASADMKARVAKGRTDAKCAA